MQASDEGKLGLSRQACRLHSWGFTLDKVSESVNRRGANQSLGRAEEARGERDVGPVCRESQCSRTATVQLIIPNALFQENDVSTYEPHKSEQ